MGRFRKGVKQNECRVNTQEKGSHRVHDSTAEQIGGRR